MLTHSHARALDIAKDKMLDIAKVHTLSETILLMFTCPVLTFFCFHFFRSVCCVMHLRVCLRVCLRVMYVFFPCALPFQLAVVRVCCRMFVVVVLVLRLSFITLPSHLSPLFIVTGETKT